MKWFLVVLMMFVTSCFNVTYGETFKGCTEEYVFGLQIKVLNQSEPVTGADVLIVDPYNGRYLEWAIERPDGNYLGAGERPGVYWIFAWAEGYPMCWSIVTVKSDDCHVITKKIELRLNSWQNVFARFGRGYSKN